MTNSRRNYFTRLLASALLIPTLAVSLAPANHTQAAQIQPTASTPTLVVGGMGNQMNPSLVGNTLVYDDCPLPYQPCTLGGYNFATQEPYQVAFNVQYLDTQGAVQRTDGATVVWTDADQQALRASSLSDNSIANLPASPAPRREIAVWGSTVVWTDGRNSKPDSPPDNDIYMLDISTGTETAISDHEFDQSHPATNGKVVVWQDSRNGGSTGFNTNIYGYDLTTKQEFVIANTANSELTPSISGNTVVWVSQGQQAGATIMAYDLLARSSVTIARAGAPADPNSFVGLNNPTIWGNIVVWVRNEYPQGPGYPLKSGIYGYDLTSGAQFTIVDDDKAIRLSPAVSGNRVVWVEYSKSGFSDGRREIMGSTISGITLAPVEVPTPKPTPTSSTFPETGKAVTGRFLDYWLKHGGLPQQGYPISEVMNEVSDLDGKSYSVQYFERAVFEAHPENQPPYDVLLSQLGALRFRQKYPDPQKPNPIHGTIKGRLSYPSEFIPSLAIYAIPADGIGSPHSVRTWANSTEYAIEGVRPGVYHVFAYIADAPNNLLNMAYTESARCQQINPTATNCNDHTLITVTVGARQTVEGISPTDFAPDIPFPSQPAGGPEAGMCRDFQETGVLVCGQFLQYWYSHGGLAQQGYPIVTPFEEVSDLNGKEYRVQYFERAIFELHPENQPPYDVLLSQLGTFRFRDKYQP